MIRGLFAAALAASTSLCVAAASSAQPAAMQAVAQGTAQAAAPRPIEDFASLPLMERPKLSPDGTRLAALIASGGKQYFAILPLTAGGKASIVASEGRDLNWWSWVNDEWLAVGVGAIDSIAGEDFYITRTLGVKADASKIVPIAFKEAAQVADEVIWIAKDGSTRIRLALQKSVYLSEEGFWPEVIEVDVATGKSKRIVRPHDGVSDWYADADGRVRMGIGHGADGRSARLYYREDDDGGFKVIDKANSSKGQSLLLPSMFLPEPGQALAVDDADGYDALYKLDLKTMTLGERVFGVKGYDIDGMVRDPKDSKLLGVSVIENAGRVHWMDAELAALQAELDTAVGDRRASIVSFNRERTVFLVHIGAADRPGAYHVVGVGDGKLQRIAHVNERIGAARLNPVKTIRYKARDGLEIPAVLTLPRSRPAKALPVIVLPHGGPYSRDAEEWDWWSQFLAERGYAVIQPNYRGSSGFGTAFALKGQGQWGLAMQDDLNDALAHLVKEGIADPKRACMAGASYGGYAAMRAAQRDGSLYRCAVSFAGVSDMPALLRYDKSFLNSGRTIDFFRGLAPDLKGVSPINYAQDFSIPILLVHGKEDRRVPVKQSRELAEKLKKAGKDVRYVEQKLGDHHFSRQEDRLEFLTELEAFLKQHNPA